MRADPVIMGDLGGRAFLDFTVLGATVNLASRIEALTKTFAAGVLLSEATRVHLDDSVGTAALPPTPIRGVMHPITLYRLCSVQGTQVDDVAATRAP